MRYLLATLSIVGITLCASAASAAGKDGSLTKAEVVDFAHKTFDKSDSNANQTLDEAELRDAQTLVTTQVLSVARRALSNKTIELKDVVADADMPKIEIKDGTEITRDAFEQYVLSLFRVTDAAVRKKMTKASDDRAVSQSQARSASDQAEADRLRQERERLEMQQRQDSSSASRQRADMQRQENERLARDRERLRQERMAQDRADADRRAKAERDAQAKKTQVASTKTAKDKADKDKADAAAKAAKDKADKDKADAKRRQAVNGGKPA